MGGRGENKAKEGTVHAGHRERVRERFRKGGLNGFADHEALELLLYYAIPRQDTNSIAHALIKRFGNLAGVFSAPVEALTEVEGVGGSTAVLLRLVPLAAQRARLEEAEVILNSKGSIGDYLLELFSQERNEAVYQLCLDRKGKLLSCKRLGEGSACAVNLDVRKLVENALLSAATSVILAHNHPSGVALPSTADQAATDRAKAALEAIGVALADHIIVADDDFVSFSESGYFT